VRARQPAGLGRVRTLTGAGIRDEIAGCGRGEQIARRVRKVLLLALALRAALAAGAARASLGEPASSVAADGRALSAATLGTTDRGAYAVHQLVAGGTTVREYASPSGVIFAVAWAGLAAPDLAPLLGSYAEEYRREASEQPRLPGRRERRVATARVVVERWGHMRDLHGRAYLPGLVPPGVSLDEIR